VLHNFIEAFFVMPLLVGQIVYTSFPAVGFKSLASQQMSLDVQQTFVQQIVHSNWDSYNPPQTGYKAAFLYQLSPDRCLFGWLYNEGNDDLGRANIPYCIGYYLTGLLSTVQLENVLTCLDMGPLVIIERDRPPIFLDNIIIPDLCNYKPARSGVPIASELRKQTHKQLLQKKLLNLFVGVSDLQKIKPREPYSSKSLAGYAPSGGKSEIDSEITIPIEAISSMGSHLDVPSQPSLNLFNLERILQDFIAKPIGIKGLALVSAEGQPILSPIGIDKNSTLIMAGSMLYLAKNTQDEFKWHDVENITVRASDGYAILVHCQSDIFLLIKAGKALSGLLEGEINRTIEKLQAVLQTRQTTENTPPTKRSEVIPQVTPEVLPKIEEVLHEFHTETPLINEDEIRYRGRRTNL
jgi:predicted regulator of Ras-like GTPase activity (Roadblock/LC7/MglB family)